MVMTKNLSKVSLFDKPQERSNKTSGWASQDIADLYRIGDQLTRFGFPVVVHTGQSDEGDPWAVFERDGTDEVVVHVARIGGELVIVDVVRDRIHRGSDFRSLADKLLAEAPLTLPRVEDRGNVVLHPRMVMTAFVAAAFVLSEFANPNAAEAASPEDDADSVPEAKAGQGRADIPVAQLDADLAEKVAGRDGLGGMYATQAIGMSGLAAGLAALSAHLVLNAAKDPVDNLGDTEQEAASLFDGTGHAQAAMPLLFDDVSLPSGKGFDTGRSAQASTTPAETGVKSGARARINVDDEGIVLAVPTPPVVVSAPPKEDATEELDSVALEHLSGEQDFRSLIVLSQHDAGAAPSSDTRSLSAAEAFDRVVASVTVLDQSWLPTFHFDGNAEGAIVVRMSDLADNMIDVNALISSFPTSSSETGMQEGAPQASSERYQLVSELSQNVHLTPESSNILVYAGGDVGVSGFTFGRDSIVFIEDLTPPDWLASVDIVGSDVVLVGHGGSVTLFDAVATFI